jgi:ferredoxin
MANRDDRIEENVPGAFYVDDQCIDCDMCRNLAPDFFGAISEGNSFVKKQPVTPEEIAFCQEAMESCPVDALSDDGEEE